MILGDAFKIKLWATNRIKELEDLAEDYIQEYQDEEQAEICFGKIAGLQEVIKYINDGVM